MNYSENFNSKLDSENIWNTAWPTSIILHTIVSLLGIRESSTCCRQYSLKNGPLFWSIVMWSAQHCLLTVFRIVLHIRRNAGSLECCSDPPLQVHRHTHQFMHSIAIGVCSWGLSHTEPKYWAGVLSPAASAVAAAGWWLDKPLTQHDVWPRK